MNADLPEPEAGMVVRFNYQWADENQPHKDRPACVIFVRVCPDPRLTSSDSEFVKEVTYLPITTKPPTNGQPSLKIPDQICSHLGLPEQSWIIISECNVQYWPADLARVPGRAGDWLYGFISPRFFRKIRDALVVELKKQRVAMQNVHYLPPRGGTSTRSD
jgi:hypothetical protein